MAIIQSLGEFVKELEFLPKKGGSSLYYRGHCNSNYILEPSVFRKVKSQKNEHLMFKEFVKERPEEFINEFSTLEKLVKMQHYGIPTRLLDITKNPLVALYFACVDSNDKVNTLINGEVVVLSIPGKLVKYNDSDTVLILSNLCKLQPKEKLFNTALNRDAFNKEENVGKLLWEIKREKPIFYDIINPKDINSIIPVKVKKNNARIKIQDGLFLLFGEGLNKTKLKIYPEWLISNTNKLFIDKNSKNKIRKQLEEINISKDTLFPELENTAAMIKRLYS
jgi:hypothetical protein